MVPTRSVIMPGYDARNEMGQMIQFQKRITYNHSATYPVQEFLAQSKVNYFDFGTFRRALKHDVLVLELLW